MTAFLGDPAPPPPDGRTSSTWYAGPAPHRHVERDCVFTRLTATHAEGDHEALMASQDYLRLWSDSAWPVSDFTVAENRAELAWHDEEHEAGVAFTYSVLDGSESRVLGCLYVRPLRDMLLTRGAEVPPECTLGADTPSARGWVRSDASPATERHVLAAALDWLTGPRWALPSIWWAAASSDDRQLALLDGLGWTRESRVGAARPGLDWVLRAPEAAGESPAPGSGEVA